MNPVVLNVDDNLDDVLLLRRACRRAESQFDVHFVEDGELAIDYLLGRGEYKDRVKHPLPTLILLDLKMPRKTGFEVLAWLRANAEFRNIPVAIFSSSTNSDDIRRAMDTGADCYLAKPLDYETLIALMRRLNDVLLGGTEISKALARLPERCVSVEGPQ